MTVNGIQETASLGETIVADAFGQREVTDLKVVRSGVGSETEGSVGRTEVTAPGKLIGNPGNANIGREVLAGTEFVGNDRTEAWEFDGRTGTVAGEHIVGSAFVGGFAVSHRTTYGDFVRNLRGMLEVFAEMDAWDLGFDALERAAVLEGA